MCSSDLFPSHDKPAMALSLVGVGFSVIVVFIAVLAGSKFLLDFVAFDIISAQLIRRNKLT